MFDEKSGRRTGEWMQARGVGRREFLAGAGGAVAAALGWSGAPRSARAQGKYTGQKVVFASWGGIYQEASKKGYCDSFAAKTGATVIQDGPVDYAKLRTMIQTGSPTWDVVDVTIDFLYNAAKDGLFEKIDTSIVDTKRSAGEIRPRVRHRQHRLVL